MTYTGKRIDVDNFNADMVCIEDIAHHLSNIKRYGGAMGFDIQYTVAEHSVHVAEEAAKLSGNNEDAIRLGLMHDATEAYLGDIVSALKASLPDYKRIEKKVEKVIFDKYGIQTGHKKLIKDIDQRILLDEIRNLKPKHYELLKAQLPNVEPLGIVIRGLMKPEYTKVWYLRSLAMFGIED